MRRHGNLYSKICDIDNLYLAYKRARKGKMWQNTVKDFEVNLDENLKVLQNMLVKKTYETSEYKTKIIYEPKLRTIYKLPFYPDRIVQHALMNVLEPIWEGLFINDSYACRIGKGIHTGSKRTMEFVRRNKYCLKCDISKFYPSIDHDILYSIVEKKIKCKDTLWLLKEIIYSIGGGKNTPIGNYTSQWFGNLYLNELDQRVKHQYKIKDYLRYCDDFCLFHDDKKYLQAVLDDMEKYLWDVLKLKMSKKDIFPVSRGVDFLGYRHFPGYILVRKSTSKRVLKRMKKLPGQLKRRDITQEQYRSSIVSTVGWLKWANSYNLYKKLNIDRLLEAIK